jgi:transposase
MPRQQLFDQLWLKFEQTLISHRIYYKLGLRLTVEGILYKLRTRCPWRDVPNFFGNWNSIFKRFNDWSFQGKWKDFFSLSQDHDNEWTFIDGSVVKAHQHSSKDAHGAEAAIGKSGTWIPRRRRQ